MGVIGFPNVGKSTLIAAVSRARPKIADYPFTTLTPNLGMVRIDDNASFVIADIPGIIEGASEGTGLGLTFLRHIERTQVLLHMLSIDPDPSREPLRDFDVLTRELASFSPELAAQPTLVALNKCDLPETQQHWESIREALSKRGLPVFTISAATSEGVQPLIEALYQNLQSQKAQL